MNASNEDRLFGIFKLLKNIFETPLLFSSTEISLKSVQLKCFQSSGRNYISIDVLTARETKNMKKVAAPLKLRRCSFGKRCLLDDLKVNNKKKR